MNPSRLLTLTCLLATAACSQAPALQPAPVAPASDAIEVGVGTMAGRTAELTLGVAGVAPRRYLLAPAPMVHHWVAADITKYQVTLKIRTATTPTEAFGDIGSGVTVDVPQGGASPKTKVVFNNLAQGSYYRAYVAAVGRNGGSAGTDPETTLNANDTHNTTDFDFTDAQDVASSLEHEVGITFDGVAFEGKGTISFSSPDPGAYINPSDGPTATATSAPN